MLEEISNMSDTELQDMIKQIEYSLETGEISEDDIITTYALYIDLLDEELDRKKRIRRAQVSAYEKAVGGMYHRLSKKKR